MGQGLGYGHTSTETLFSHGLSGKAAGGGGGDGRSGDDDGGVVSCAAGRSRSTTGKGRGGSEWDQLIFWQPSSRIPLHPRSYPVLHLPQRP